MDCNRALLGALGLGIMFLLSAGLVYYAYNDFLSMFISAGPRQLTFYQAMCGVLFLGVVRGVWCCPSMLA